ncbi:hypothetical protein N7519_009206 [Penicillium mononematosum]|uniref:uncharacterized protein n=1 Tax=Penicillium mononematosum TaxID=268346 RepID=UPI0025483527|nr:uncharacterized protein N7519_009206 [Penicillium mononematosum]KAJ6178745.1 hypothetical protein N7519_009206 [Penicillium mononematosum]
MPEYAVTHHSNRPLHNTPSPLEDWYHSHCNSYQNESQSRELPTYRWVRGPPSPAVATRRGTTYYAELSIVYPESSHLLEIRSIKKWAEF